jgi:ankyrin repeat protein
MIRIAAFIILLTVVSCVERKTPPLVSKPAKSLTATEREVLFRENGLLKDGFFGYTPLILASYMGDVGEVRNQLDQGADVNWKMEWGLTALMWAADQGRMDIVILLMEKGADVNAENEDGLSALILAKREGRSEIVNVLLTHGVNPK